MKLLLDSCVSSQVARALRNIGHDVESVAEWAQDPGDDEILAAARAEQRVLITLDKDFGELAVVGEKAHQGIVRLVDIPLAAQATQCEEALTRFDPDLTLGAIVTIEPGRTRVRPPSALDV